MIGKEFAARPAPRGANHTVGTGTGNGSFSETIISAAYAAGERERGLSGRMDVPTCKCCGGELDYVDASRTCTRCVERHARSEEYLDALQRGYRPDERGDWRRI